MVHHTEHEDSSSKYIDVINETVDRTLTQPSIVGRTLNLKLEKTMKFYEVAQFYCQIVSRAPVKAVNLNVTDNAINCNSEDFNVTITESLKNIETDPPYLIQMGKKVCGLGGDKAKLKINLHINVTDDITETKVFNQSTSIQRHLTNMNTKEVLVNFSEELNNSEFHTCLTFHPNSIYSTSNGTRATFIQSQDQIELNFDHPLEQDTVVAITCHPDVAWRLDISIEVIDYVDIGYAAIGTISTVTFISMACLMYILYAKSRRKIKDYNFDEILQNENCIVIVNNTESDSEEGLEMEMKSENQRLLENEFGTDDLNRVWQPFESVVVNEELGRGQFGTVSRGYLHIGDFTKVEVAIKEASNAEGKKDLIHEAKTMARVKRNKYIVNLQGITYNDEKIYLLLEYW